MKLPAAKDIVFVGVQLLLFVIYFLPLIDFRFTVNPFVGYAALALTFAGLFIVLFAFLQMNTSLTPFPTPSENGKLIQNGLYKYIRHPIYTGIILASIGFGIYRDSLWQIIVGCVLWIFFYFKSSYEEELLARRFPQYADYRRNTSRFFPFV
jgi:protein-S-isoprenylcysteine O-methyltransferase Ste14